MTSIRICPRCKKATLRQAFNVSGWLGPDMYECTNCKYVGAYFIEVDTEEFNGEQ